MLKFSNQHSLIPLTWKSFKRGIKLKKKYYILYWIRIFLTIVYIGLLFFLLSNILNAGWQGNLFLMLSICFVGITLFSLIKKNQSIKTNKVYNLLSIGTICYAFLIYVRLCLDDRVKLTMIYQLDMTYFKNNYLFLSLILLGIISYTILFLWEEKDVK